MTQRNPSCVCAAGKSHAGPAVLSGKEPEAEGISNCLGWERMGEAVRKFCDTPATPLWASHSPPLGAGGCEEHRLCHKTNPGWGWSPSFVCYSHVTLASDLTSLGFYKWENLCLCK